MQKIHDNEVCKVDMWLFVEEVRAHQLVMVFGVVVAKAGAYRGPVNLELSLSGAIPDSVEAHFNCLQRFLLDNIVFKPN